MRKQYISIAALFKDPLLYVASKLFHMEYI